MKKINVFVLCLMFVQLAVLAQNPKAPKGLTVGDAVPDLLIAEIINFKTGKARISDFKNSLLILDFWDTNCSSCIEALQRMDSLQRQFGDKITILPVSWQDKDLVAKFFKTNKYVKNLKLPSVVEDQVLKSYFKHLTISHEVWIYKGKVVAITGSPYVTEDNIKDVLEEKLINWPIKNEIAGYDYNLPLMHIDTNVSRYLGSDFIEYSAITGYKDGALWKAGHTKDTLKRTVRNYMINFPIVQLYHQAMSKIKMAPFSTIPEHVILEGKDKSTYFYNSRDGFQEEWTRKNALCYETVLPDSLTEAAQGKRMVEDLDRLLRLRGRVERRKMPCLVLVQKGELNPKQMHKTDVATSIFRIVMSINIERKYPPVVDETGFKGEIYLGNWTTVAELKSLLRQKGFDLLEEEREVDTFVLTELD
ncbi:TlpA family protein disulfide reductase [Pedobacter gandavensis]|uniref:TlpA family protein disulfide reductase n=1 Tax=Pedobacter gandavensis TaxID=2679963 RepID=UPI00292D8AC0|nr:redoxin domain-containing protein [Pedobacter gandavensis]